ncbi:ribbon-helix-helix protein, CopG family [Candidatus Peregrinibacteria bacterium]|nr:ribbon-helix-helix protein, CopG family [Candidatus Peregrinibacteria bacterium]
MSTLSVPLPEDMMRSLNMLVKRGVAANKADAVRHALRMYLEDQAVKTVIEASKEPSLKGDLDTLAKKL